MGVPVPRRGQRAFTLIELLTVLVIIAILLAVAVPLLLRSRIAAHESAAVGAMRLLSTSEEQYRVENKRYGTLAEMAAATVVPRDLGQGEKSSYLFDAFADPATWGAQYYAEGVPEGYKSVGINSFYVDESGVIRFRDTGGNAYAPRADAETWTEIGN